MIKTNKIPWLDSILFGKLRPWLDENREEEQFIDMLYELDQAEPFLENHSLNFYTSFNPITDYYKKYIETKSTEFIHEVDVKIQDQEHDISKTYTLKNLIRRIDYYLHKLSESIKAKSYDITYIDPDKSSLELEEDFKTEVWIIYYALYTLIKVRMELTIIHEPIFPDDINKYDEKDIFRRILKQTNPARLFIQNLEKINLEAAQKKYSHENTPTQTNTPPSKGKNPEVFNFKNLPLNNNLIDDLYEDLKDQNFITATKGNITDFRKMFSGRSGYKPIVWDRSISELHYFIKLIHYTKKIVEDTNKQQYKIASKCFCKPDGSHWTPNEIKDQKKPKATATDLEKLIPNL